MILSKAFLETLQIDGTQKLGKSNLSQFSQKNAVLGKVGNLGPIRLKITQSFAS